MAWLFDSRGVISVQPDGADPDDVALKAIDAGADDFRVDDEGIEIYTDPAQLDTVRAALEQEQGDGERRRDGDGPEDDAGAASRRIPSRCCKLMERLEELDDVQRVYSNLELSEEALKQFA